MTNELKPCPFCGETPSTGLCGERVMHDCKTLKALISGTVEDWNTRYKRTCKMEYSGDPKSDENPFRVCSKCGAYNIDSEYYSANCHRTVMKFCPECGAEVEFDGR